MKYTCKYCNFETPTISNYNRHLKTEKHLSNCPKYEKKELIKKKDFKEKIKLLEETIKCLEEKVKFLEQKDIINQEKDKNNQDKIKYLEQKDKDSQEKNMILEQKLHKCEIDSLEKRLELRDS